MTAFCPEDGSRHADIRSQYPSANFCPLCCQRLPLLSTSSSTIDLTLDSPPTTPNTQVRGNAMTIPSVRTRPMPISYAQAQAAAVESQRRSIAITGRTTPITIDFVAAFWICDGYLKAINESYKIPIYAGKAYCVARHTAKFKAVLASTFPSHKAMIEFIVGTCKKELLSMDWKVVSSFSNSGPTIGPFEFNDSVYEAVSLSSFFEAANIAIPKRPNSPISFTFFNFNVLPMSDFPIDSTKPVRKRAKRQAEPIADLEPCAPSKRKVASKIKNEPVSSVKREYGIKEEVKTEDNNTADAVSFTWEDNGNESDTSAILATYQEDIIAVEQPIEEEGPDEQPIEEEGPDEQPIEENRPIKKKGIERKVLPTRAKRGKNPRNS
jgi:hypothetical protein